MKYCLFIDIDFSSNAALLADAIRKKDPDAKFCVLQGTTPNATDDFLQHCQMV